MPSLSQVVWWPGGVIKVKTRRIQEARRDAEAASQRLAEYQARAAAARKSAGRRRVAIRGNCDRPVAKSELVGSGWLATHMPGIGSRPVRQIVLLVRPLPEPR